MPLFCDLCSNLLVVSTTSDTFHFKCLNCEKNFEPNDTDSLRYEETNTSNYNIYKTLLKNAGDDPINPKIKCTCPKCSHNMAKQIRLGEEMRIINTCIKCKHSWLSISKEN